MDIMSKKDYPAGALTNFAAHSFVIDGVECASMEGFLQTLKTPNPINQIEICALVGIKAKNRGTEYNSWKENQVLNWRGKKYDRHGQAYQQLLDRAYDELAKNEEFRKALLATGQEELTHSIGNPDPTDTVLTEEEFCSRLMNLRSTISS